MYSLIKEISNDNIYCLAQLLIILIEIININLFFIYFILLYFILYHIILNNYYYKTIQLYHFMYEKSLILFDDKIKENIKS